MSLTRGLYDLVLTDSVERFLTATAPDLFDVAELSDEEAADRFVDALSKQLKSILSDLSQGEKGGAIAQLEIINGLLAWMRAAHSLEDGQIDALSPPPRILKAIRGSADAVPIPPEP